MNPLNLVISAYERKALLYPALLVIAPLVVTAAAILSACLSWSHSLWASIVAFGGVSLLTQLARDSGKKGEKALFLKWGGMPSIAIFRHRDKRLDSVTKVRYHNKLAALVKEAKAPTLEDEQNNPDVADEAYSAWSNFLRTNTRDVKKFSLLFEENVSYGYRRNVWGLRPYGIAACLLSCVVCAARLRWGHSTEKLDVPLVGAGIFSFSMLTLWLLCFSSDWVRIPADAYAERLAECAETLSTKMSSPKK